ncbi:MAG: hypothetical protein ACRDGB_09030, partial [Candidatus Limnocylindria bacterium]
MSTIWTQRIAGPKAWRGDELGAGTSWIVTLGESEIADIDRALAVAKATGLPLADLEREHFPFEIMRARLEQ